MIRRYRHARAAPYPGPRPAPERSAELRRLREELSAAFLASDLRRHGDLSAEIARLLREK